MFDVNKVDGYGQRTFGETGKGMRGMKKVKIMERDGIQADGILRGEIQRDGMQTQRQAAADYEYSTLMQLLGVSVSKHLLDEHFTLVWANDFYYQMIGWSKVEYEAEFHNRPDLYYATDQGEWERITSVVMDTLSKGEKGYKLATRMRRKNGEHIWVQFSVRFADEYVDGYQVAYTVITNIDDMIQMQKEQSVTYENLPGFVAKYRIDQELNMVLLQANARFAEYFGSGADHGQSSLYQKNINDNWEAILAQKENIQAGKPLRFIMHVKSTAGQMLWLQVNASCVDWQNGCPIYLAIFIDVTDVTELREMQRKLTQQTKALKNALHEAEKANRAKSDFLSRMSHDIRTPMNAILGMTTIAQSHIFDPERIQDCLGKITVSSKLLLSLINEVLDMSKIESGHIVLAEEEVNLAELVHGVVTMVQPQIHSKNLVFKTYINRISHETVISDLQRLQQVILNLLSNAVKYTPPEGSIVLEINERTSERADMAYYEFVVSDTGIGMKPEFLNKVFDPFERADDDQIQSIQGTGLGLSICKSIAELMGGKIQVESAYGKGSKFTVSVYLKIQEEHIDESALVGLPILIVDDDEFICRNTCERLEEFGLKTQWATQGAEALKKIEQAKNAGEDYFAVIIDYKMPDMDGIETIRAIRESVGEELPIIMISAYDLSEQIDEAKLAGANGFITKPLFCSRLVYKLKQFLDGRCKEQSVEPVIKTSYAGKRFLLVEDNELNREIVVEILSDAGALVDVAENGKIAVEKVAQSKEGSYDLIFMDMQMPVMDGCTATMKIRSLEREDVKTMPIIAMTANAFADDRQKTRAAGMNGHLAKPIDMEQLQILLQKWLP